MADRVVVMYGGKVVETGTIDEIFHAPRHPYTLGLMMSLPRLTVNLTRLRPIPGQPPSLINRPPGCAFHPRCGMSAGRELCRQEVPTLASTNGGGHFSACHFFTEVARELEMQAADLGIHAEGGVLDDVG